MHSVPYQASRMVPTSSYNSYTKSYQTTYRTQFYTAYRTEFRYETTWSWQMVTEWRAKVLPSTYYSFSLDDHQRLTVYQKDGRYFLQNPTYIAAKDENGVNCLLVDFNANGSYFDPQDRVMWSAWNPYDQGSKYKQVKGVRGNAWYSLLDLEDSQLVTMTEAEGKLKMTSLNQQYAGVKGKGTVNFLGVPQDAVVKVNGQSVRLNAKGKPLAAEYGEYHYVISRTGRLDTLGSFVVDADHLAPQIEYK
jgi:hypothetical protein